MNVDPISDSFGAVVTEIDLKQPLADPALADLERAWHRYAVLLFPAQHLSDDEQIAFTRYFGRLELGIGRGTSALGHISNVKRDGAVAKPTDLQARFHLGNTFWHSDSSYKHVGAKASILAARKVPSTGGETEWADMRAAYDALDPTTRARIDGKIAVHSYVYSHAWHGGLEILSEDALSHLGPVEHPLVKVHPGSQRKTLFVGRHASHIVGEDIDESRALLKQLTENACQPPRLWKHRWTVGDIVIWDNRCVLHRGHLWPPEEARDMVRTTVAGDDPLNQWVLGPAADGRVIV